MSLFQRVLNYLVSETITKRLANSQLFQKLAVRTHHNIQHIQKKGAEIFAKESLENVQKQIKDAGNQFKNVEPVQRVSTFFTAFRNNISKEMEAFNKQNQSRK